MAARRRHHRDRGRAPPALRRLVTAEGQARQGGGLGGGGPPRGGGGAGDALPSRRGARAGQLRRPQGAREGRALLADGARGRHRLRAQRRGRPAALAGAPGGRRRAHLPARQGARASRRRAAGMNREHFPGLADVTWTRLDGPAGTQMVDTAIEAMAAWMRSGRGANHGGQFAAAQATDELIETARASAGALIGAPPAEIVFGFSMTALTMAFAAAVGRTLAPGDEIVCTRLDHDANVRPWVIHAERNGATVRFADPEAETLELPASAVEAVLSERTRWVAVTGASNAVGTIPDLSGIAAAAHDADARV